LSIITEFQEAIGTAAARVGPATVGFGRGWGRGSGVVVAPERVVTNAHNLRSDEVTVVFGDGRRERGRVAGLDADLDLAVVEVATGDTEPVAQNPTREAPPIGEAVIALASPGGRGLRATPGFVSSAPRSFRAPRGRRITGAIEHTAPLPRGSGGGPLVDLDGTLLGLNSIRLDGGLILAVPANAAFADAVDRLARGEAPRRLRLGVAIAPAHVARRLRGAVGLPDRAGVLVRSVADASPAERAGIERGDLIVRAGGTEIDGIDALYRALDAVEPDSALELELLRGAEERRVSVAFDQEAEENNEKNNEDNNEKAAR
jgi:serine protease Do